MLVPTNFTLFSLFFQFLQIRRQLVDVGIGQGIGFCQSRHEAAGDCHTLLLSAGRYSFRVRATPF